jgi:hypothetical protein
MLAVHAIKAAGVGRQGQVRDAMEATRGYVGTGGVVNMSPSDHMGLDLSAFRMLEVQQRQLVAGQVMAPHTGSHGLRLAPVHRQRADRGAIYALVALGFTIVFNASGAINFAQGEFVMIGGMSAVTLMALGLPLPAAILLAVLAACWWRC